jgi:hypothetical protein
MENRNIMYDAAALCETISGRAGDQNWAKEVKSHKEISLFCDLNSIYTVVVSIYNYGLFHYGISKKILFALILQSNKKNQVSQLLVHATLSWTFRSLQACIYIYSLSIQRYNGTHIILIIN